MSKLKVGKKETTPTSNTSDEIDDILHDFAVAESLSETQLYDKLRRKVITADEYDDRLVENYRENKARTKAAIEAHCNKAVEAKLQAIVDKYYAEDFGTYDFDGIAEDVLAELSLLKQEAKS